MNDFINNPLYAQYMNLIRFNTNLSEFADVGELKNLSPDYILEKYDHWINFEPNSNWEGHIPDICNYNIITYTKIWGNPNNKLLRILIYLSLTKLMNLYHMIEKFEIYIGPISNIPNNKPKKGLHLLLEEKVIPEIIKINEKYIKIIIRDQKIKLITQ